MRRFSGLISLLSAIIPFIAVANGIAASSDQKLLSLVPPGVTLLAGISPGETKSLHGIVFLSTTLTRQDYIDFFALTGVDSSRHVAHVLLTDFPGQTCQHGLLASGHFDQARIYKSVINQGAQMVNYRGISVARIEPFKRERATFQEERWLAILDSRFLLFGAFDVVHEELDRYLAHSAPDPTLTQKIAGLRHADATWSLLSVPGHYSAIRDALISLDRKLVSLPQDGVVQFGVRYGKVIELEYDITNSAELAYSAPTSLTPQIGESSPSPEAPIGVGEHRFRGVLKIPADRYNAWFEELSSQGRAQSAGGH